MRQADIEDDQIEQPAVLGELLAGIVLGPSVLGLVPLSEGVFLLSEIGVVLLLFEVGLETDLRELIRVAREITEHGFEETEDVRALVDFVGEAEFTHAGVFLYELLEAGAPARDLEAALRARYQDVRAAAVGRRPRRSILRATSSVRP